MAIFSNMDGSDNKFLHNIDLKSLSKETGLSYKEIAELAKIGPKVVYKWHYSHNDSSRPDYNALVRLLQHGATTKTLFGVDSEPRKNEAPTLEFLNGPAFMEGLREQLIKDFKEKGLMLEGNVRELVRQEIDRLSNEKSDEKI